MQLLTQAQVHKQKKKNVEYEYLPKQGKFLKNCDEVNYSGYIGGFGSGKTHILCVEALRLGTTPSHGLIGAPTYRMLEDTTQSKFLELCPPSWIKNFSKQRNMIELINGTTILFRSMDNPGRLAGLDIDWFEIDEGGLVKEDTFKMLQGRLKKSKIRKGIVTGNPAGPTHWTYKYFVQLAKRFPDVYRLVQSPSRDNTFLPREFIRDMDISFGVGTAYHKQYVLGQFVAFEGAYWPNYDPRPYSEGGHVMTMLDATKASEKGVQKWGRVIDFGFEHPFVVLWYFTDGNAIVFFDEYYQQHGLIRHHCLKMREKEELHQKIFGPHRIDRTWTDHEAVSRAEISAARDDKGNRIGYDCVPVEKKVMESILLVQSLFGMHRLFITENCEKSLQEIPSYHSRKNIIGEEPERIDDDTCSCVRYATWAELNHSVPYKRYKDMSYGLADVSDVYEMETRW